LIAIAVLVFVVLINGAIIVPQKISFIIERLGKYHRTLDAGFHILIPFVDRAAYRFGLKEQVVDIPAQICITKDNVSVDDGGVEALNMRLAEQYISQFGNLAKTTHTIIMPSNVADVAGLIATAMSTVREIK